MSSITVKRDELHYVLRAAERVAARRENLPVLNGVLLDARNPGNLILAATDLELAIRATLPASGDGGWARIVDAKLLAGLSGKLPGNDVRLEFDGESMLRVESGAARFHLVSMESGEFPELPAPDSRATARLTAGTLAGMLGRVAFAAAESSQRPVLSGVYVEVNQSMVTIAATDSSRLAVETVSLDAPATALDGTVPAIVPRRSVEEAARLVGTVGYGTQVTLEVGSRLVALRAGGYVLVSRLIEGTFPPVRHVLLENPAHRVVLERRALLDAVTRLALLARAGTPAVVVFEPADEPGQVVLRSEAADMGKGTEMLRVVDASWPAGMRAAYQARFIEEFLHAVQNEVVWYAVSDPTSRCEWQVDGLSLRYVVMPVRLWGDNIAEKPAKAA